MILCLAPLTLAAQDNADFSAATGSWGDDDGPPGWQLVLGDEDQRGVVESFGRSTHGGRAFRFVGTTGNFGTSRLEQCLPLADRHGLALRVLALTDYPDNDVALRLRMDFFADDACTQDAVGASAARIESDHAFGRDTVVAGEWNEQQSPARLRDELDAGASHVRISVRQRDRRQVDDPPLQLWLDRVDLIDPTVRIAASERVALLALHLATEGEQWRNDDGWGGAAGSECDWFGVRCSADRQRVVALDLSDNGLIGTLPSALVDLIHLQPDNGLRLCWNTLDIESDEVDAFITGHLLGGDWRSCQGSRPVQSSRAHGGVWNDPEHAGERLLVSPLSSQSMLLDWTGFDQAGQPIWFTAMGKARQRRFEYPQVVIVHRDGEQAVPALAGQAELSYLDCNRARLAYSLEFDGNRHRGVRLLQRQSAIGAAIACPAMAADAAVHELAGHWFDPQRSGEGLVVQPLSTQAMTLHWLSYDSEGRPQWLHGSTPFFASLTHYAVPMWRASGGRFEGVAPEDGIEQEPAGIAILVRSEADRLHLLLPGQLQGYRLQRVEAFPLLQASAPHQLHVDMAPEDLRELYVRSAWDDTVLPATARYSVDGDEHGLVGIRFRGNTARALPKKSFNIRFQSRQPVLFGSDRMNLNAGWSDPLMMREALAMDLFRDLGRMAPRTRRFDLFLNGVYEGLYTHIERVDRDLVAAYGHNEGTLVRDQFRGATSDPEVPVSSLFGFDLLTIPESEREAFVADRFDSRGNPDWSALVELALWVQSTPAGNAFAEGFAERFDVEHFIDWLAVHVLIGDIDSFGDDYWLHLDPDQETPRWRTIPWDKDLSFGSHFRNHHGVDNDYFHYEYPIASNFNNGLIERFLTTASLRTALEQRLMTLAEEVFTPDYFQAEVSSWSEILQDSIEITAGASAFHRHPANHHGATGHHALHQQALLDFVQRRGRFLQRRIQGSNGPPYRATVDAAAGKADALWFTGAGGWTIGRIEPAGPTPSVRATLSVAHRADARGIDRIWTLDSSRALGPAQLVVYYRNEVSPQFGANWVSAGNEPVGEQDQLRGYAIVDGCLQPLPTVVNPYANRVQLDVDLVDGVQRYVMLEDAEGLPGHALCAEDA